MKPYLLPLLIILCLSGCIDLFDGIFTTQLIYESQPTTISYYLSYGYNISFEGEGFHQVEYLLNTPEVLEGDAEIVDVYMENKSKLVSHSGNTMILWNITGGGTISYKLGVTASITTRSFVISDLNGEEASLLDDIPSLYPEVYHQYTQPQGNSTVILINPTASSIKETAYSILNKLGNRNAFSVAKELFIWLKKHTTYKPHGEINNVQPATVTLIKGSGDCDDLSFLYISLCRAIGLPARFIRGCLINEEDLVVTPHVWVEVFVGGELGWIPVECAGSGELESEVHQNFAAEDVFHLRLFIDDGSNEAIETIFSPLIARYDNGVNVEMKSFAYISNYNVLEMRELVVEEGKRSYR